MSEKPTIDNPAGDAAQVTSKSQRKRELQALLALTERALGLSDDRLAATGLNEKALQAFAEVRKMKASGARNRQLKYISKLIRNEDVSVLERYLDEAGDARRKEAQLLHRLEQWRERLLDNGDAAINDLLTEFPHADRQQLRQLLRTAQKEQQQHKPPAAARKLFRYLRELATAAEDGFNSNY